MNSFILILSAAVFFYVYKSQKLKLSLKNTVITTIIGLFVFSVTINTSYGSLKIPVLPLGVWFLYWFLRRDKQNERWQRYRRFAWLGYFLNFGFLLSNMLVFPLTSFLYPEGKLTTFIGDTTKAKVILTNPSSLPVKLDKTLLKKQLVHAKEKHANGTDWYYDSTVHENKAPERFPYYLADTKVKSGKGGGVQIFIEKNGKGLLISTSKGQHYFQFQRSVLKEVAHDQK